MDQIVIYPGDLESCAAAVGDVPEQLRTLDNETALREATIGMPGSRSNRQAAACGVAVDERCRKAAASLTQFKTNLLAAAASYSTSEDDTEEAWNRFSREVSAAPGDPVTYDVRTKRPVGTGGGR